MKLAEIPIHHAVLFECPSREGITEPLWKELSSSSSAHRFFDQTVLDIDTARAIISWAQAPYNEEKIGLISFVNATLPAQNAMLKIVEEPSPNVRFIFVISNKNILLDTFLSRVRYVATDHADIDQKLATLFLKTRSSDRMKLAFIVELLARVDEEGRKDREGIRAFILSLAESLGKRTSQSKFVTETLTVANYASDASASGKMLLEYLSLLLPQTK